MLTSRAAWPNMGTGGYEMTTDERKDWGSHGGQCRVCGRRCAPDHTLCRGCEEDRDMGYRPDEDEEATT